MNRRRKLSDDPFVRMIQQHGYRKVQRAVNFAVAWAFLEDKLGHPPTMTEYLSSEVAISRTGAFRQQEAFRDVTGDETPAAVIAAARAAGISFSKRAGPAEALGLVPFMAS